MLREKRERTESERWGLGGRRGDISEERRGRSCWKITKKATSSYV